MSTLILAAFILALFGYVARELLKTSRDHEQAFTGEDDD